jgi:hypothetical protein
MRGLLFWIHRPKAQSSRVSLTLGERDGTFPRPENVGGKLGVTLLARTCDEAFNRRSS